MLIDNIEYKKLEQEIIRVNNSLKNSNVSNLELNKNITIKNKKIEHSIEKYLNNIMLTTASIMNIINDNEYKNIIEINNLKNKDINSLYNYLTETKNKLNNLGLELSNIKNKNISDPNYNNLLDKIDLNNYKVLIDDNLNKIAEYEKILNYLKDNNNYKIENNKVIFLKRNDYDNFQNFINNIQVSKLNMFSYDLTKDLEGPLINANDVTIYEGDYYNLNNNISCIDAIDGEVTCNIDGDYNRNQIGNYKIKISATDKSGITSEKIININVIEKEKLKYYGEIIRNYNTVIIYELDENKEYTKIAKVFPCSTGRNGRTPTGTFYTKKGGAWGSLMGGVFGQYYTVITGDILFHSVPYYSMSKDNLEWEEYNKLGDYASAGCVRLSVNDAKWIYENCPNGMQIKIYDGELPVGVSKPLALKIDESSPFKGWDPTDPDINNPWNKVE